MPNSSVIDLVILLSFTYFIGALILSAINEAIAGGLRLRQKQLKFALENMLFGSEWKRFVRNQLQKSPHIESLMRRSGKYPAYIPAKSIVHVIVEQFRKANHPNVAYERGKLYFSIQQTQLVIPEALREVLLDFAKQVEAMYPANLQTPGDNKQIEEFEKRIEEFYDSAMDRAGGWYKRKSRSMLLVLAIILSVALNIDTVKITNDALRDKEKLGSAVDNISANISDWERLNSVSVTDSSLVITKKPADVSSDASEIRFHYEQTSGFALGYKDFFEEWKGDFFLKTIGILITAFALQLGSNYWFDLMNKAVNIRAVGKRPDEKRPPQI